MAELAASPSPSPTVGSPSGPEPPLPVRGEGWLRRNRAPIVLVVLAVTIPELLTGSTPVTSLLNPIAVAGLLGFYGAGVLVIREASIFYRRGWTMVLLLGLAYGVAEEGIATKTMIDPASGAAGFLGIYGHAFGINWVFAVVIALFHALYSIALPILLVELLYPATKGRRFLTNQGAGWALGLLGLSVTWGYFGFDPHYFEGYLVLAFLLLVLAGLIVAAFVVPARWLRPRQERPSLSPRSFLALGIAFAAGWSLFYLLAPHLIPFPVVVILGEFAASLGVLRVVVRNAGAVGNERHKLYFAAGLLSWYLPWDFVVTFALQDYLVGLVLAAVFVVLWRLAARLRSGAEPLRLDGSDARATGPAL
jgi:hypothetical protein